MSLSWTSIVSNFQYGNGGFFLVRSAKMLMTCSSSKTSLRQSIKDAANIFFFENIVQETQKDAKLWKLVLVLVIGTFRSDYDYDYEYEFFNVYPVRMPDCVRLSRQLVLSSKSRRHLDANNEIFKKSRPPTTSSLQVQRRVKRLVFKGADTLWNVTCNLSRNVLATLWHLVLFVY